MALPRYASRWWLALCLALAVACSSAADGAPATRPLPRPAAPPPVRAVAGPGHIVVIALENREYGDIVGSSSAPYLNGLAAGGVLLTRGYATTHPSLPNYFSLTAGGTFGVTTDCTTCAIRGRNLVDQLAAHRVSWKAYMQSMPRPCYTGAYAGSGSHIYAKRHDPFMYFNDVRRRPARCARIVPLHQLVGDLNGHLPRFSWITPDLCHDMHSCPIGVGDRWLRAWVPRIVPRLGTDGILLILFDEGTSNAGCCPRSAGGGGGHIMAVVAGPGAGSGVRLSRPSNHYSILRLIDDAWGMPRLRHAADARTPTIWGWKA